jgi:hypothetical protein
MEEIIVEIPGVGEVAFPASMGMDAINATAARLYQEAQQQAPQPVQPRPTGPDFTTPTTATYDASAEQMMSGVPYTGMPAESGIDQAAGGFMRGSLYDPLAAVAQIGGGQATRERVSQIEQSYQQMRQQRGDTGFEGSRLLGNIASPVGVAAPLRAAQAARALGPAAQAVAGGAVGASLQPTMGATDLGSFATEKATQIGVGGALGLGTYFGGKALAPQLKEGVDELIAKGIPVTPGQAYQGAPGWFFRQIESLDIPFLRVNKEVLNQQFTRAVGNDVLSSLGKQVPTDARTGQEVFTAVHNEIRKTYDNALKNIGTVNANPLVNSINEAVAIAKAQFPTARQAKSFENIINANVLKRVKDGSITGKDLKEVEEFLRKQSKKIKGIDLDADIARSGYDEALKTVKGFIQQVDTTGDVSKANQAYLKRARFKSAVEKSLTDVPGAGGAVTPQKMLTESIRQGEGSQAALGTAPMQRQAQQAFDVVGETAGEATKYRNLLIAGKVTGLGIYGIFQPQIAIPLLVASGVSYDIAKAMVNSPSLRSALNQAVEKLGPTQVSRIVTQQTGQPPAEEQ